MAQALFGKKDKVLILAVITVAVVLSFGLWLQQRTTGIKVRITIDGEIFGEYTLSQNQVIAIVGQQGSNQLVIADGSAYMAKADCPDKYCMQYRPISKQHEVIVCLPHKLVVEVLGKDKETAATPDIIAQ